MDRTALRGLADASLLATDPRQAVPGNGLRYHGRGQGFAFRIGNDNGPTVFDDGRNRIGGAQVYADCLIHGLLFVPLKLLDGSNDFFSGETVLLIKL